MSEGKMAVVHWDYLTQRGYRPEWTPEGYITFKREGRFYCIQPDEHDPQFFRLLFPNFYNVNDEFDRNMVLEAIGRATEGVKVSKVFIVDNQVWASVELFVISAGHAMEFIERCLECVDRSVQRFLQEMQES